MLALLKKALALPIENANAVDPHSKPQSVGSARQCLEGNGNAHPKSLVIVANNATRKSQIAFDVRKGWT